MDKWPEKETELAGELIKWLEENNWDVYQEVQFEFYGKIADVVAARGAFIHIFETKKSFSIKLLEQAYGWKKYAHNISCVVPILRTSDMWFKREICKKFRIGLIEIMNPELSSKNVNVLEEPWLNHNVDGFYIREFLTLEHKTFAIAGNADGKYFTPFQGTCIEVLKLVKEYPGIDLKTLILNIDHHYSSDATARACISRFAHDEVIGGVKVEREGKFLKFYPREE